MIIGLPSAGGAGGMGEAFEARQAASTYNFLSRFLNLHRRYAEGKRFNRPWTPRGRVPTIRVLNSANGVPPFLRPPAPGSVLRALASEGQIE